MAYHQSASDSQKEFLRAKVASAAGGNFSKETKMGVCPHARRQWTPGHDTVHHPPLTARLESHLCCERPGFLRVCVSVKNPRQS